MNLPEWLVLWVWQALIGEIYPEIRAIALRYDANKNLLIRYYFDHEPTEDDLESIECVITNILAHTSSNEDIKNIDDEAIFQMKEWLIWMRWMVWCMQDENIRRTTRYYCNCGEKSSGVFNDFLPLLPHA